MTPRCDPRRGGKSVLISHFRRSWVEAMTTSSRRRGFSLAAFASAPRELGVGGRRFELRSCLSLESSAPASVRWLQENQGKHRCQCGCGEAIELQVRHYWERGIPRFVHGHQNRRGHWGVLQLRQAGYLTVSDVARALGIGTTTLRRRDGTVYPRTARIDGIRVYREADVERLRRRGEPSATV